MGKYLFGAVLGLCVGLSVATAGGRMDVTNPIREIKPVAETTLEGTLKREILPTCDPRGGSMEMWTLVILDKTYYLRLDDKQLDQARKLVGQEVRLTGTLTGTSMKVNKIDVVPVGCLPPPWLDDKAPRWFLQEFAN
jgi:hypothetical protein